MAVVRPYLSSWRLGKTVKEVVAMIPCLQDGGYAWIGGSNIEKGRQLIKANSNKLFRNVAEVLTDAPSVDNIDMPEVVLRPEAWREG
ncbi:hypothetical protein BSL78_10218 [Apostichopus japonicus]|uniref:Uncharacterized protein n=1 Tax=Stichopus japonicus TaxID=307972 RepID=A0A2G8KXZ8_STIJA|nr:hypothetical protein BSL78_10218 [Apostichopus japonicus]